MIQVHKFTSAKARGLVEKIKLDQPGGEKFEEEKKLSRRVQQLMDLCKWI